MTSRIRCHVAADDEDAVPPVVVGGTEVATGSMDLASATGGPGTIHSRMFPFSVSRIYLHSIERDLGTVEARVVKYLGAEATAPINHTIVASATNQSFSAGDSGSMAFTNYKFNAGDRCGICIKAGSLSSTGNIIYTILVKDYYNEEIMDF